MPFAYFVQSYVAGHAHSHENINMSKSNSHHVMDICVIFSFFSSPSFFFFGVVLQALQESL